ncbi:MAG: hypothetical protein ABI548_17205 [Polyangiaceae bacterium]
MNDRNRLVVPFALGLLVSSLGSACSSSTPGGQSSNGDGGASNGDGGASSGDSGRSTQADSGASGVGGSEVDGDSDGGTTNADPSAVVVTQAFSDGAYSGGVAAFIDEHYSVDPRQCTSSTSGPCKISNCSAVSDSADVLSDSAGTITLTGGKIPAQTLSFADGSYMGTSLKVQLFAPGDIFKVSAAGGTFPAFSGMSAAAPGPVTITSPAPVGNVLGGPVYPVSLSSALTFAWSGGTAGASTDFTVVNDAGDLITCSFDSGASTGTIPASVVAQFSSGSTSFPVTLVSGTRSSVTLPNGVVLIVQSTTGILWYSTQ